MAGVQALAPESLFRGVDLEAFDFETTDDLPEFTQILGQDRAVEAVKFGLGIEQEGYNLFALGPTGTGKHALLRDFFEERATQKPVPMDWCYVNNFEEAHKPRALKLPAGLGTEFRGDMEKLVEELQTALRSALESEEYQNRRQELQESFQERQEKAFEELRRKADAEGFALLRTPAGLGFAPVREGEVVAPEEFQNLPDEERKVMEAKVEELQEDLQKILRQMPRLQRELQEKLRELKQEIAHLSAGGLIDELREKYKDQQEVIDFLDEIEHDVIENVDDFLPAEQTQSAAEQVVQLVAGGGGRRQRAEQGLRRYRVNVIVDHSQSEHGPVVEEDNPTYTNLIGRIEHIPQMGALLTDFNLIKPGALHLANGGYLLLDARKVLLQPFAWEGLKRALRNQEIRIESPGQAYGLITTVSLDPEPIPINLKVALVGERLLYYLLSELDPEFDQLFRVMVDFGDSMDRNQDNHKAYAQLVATLARKEKLQAFDRGAVARVIEHSSRLVGDSEKLSARMRVITNLLREANYWARTNGNGVVTRADVQQALEKEIYRADRLRERMQEAIQRDTILIDTEGERVGQINGLAVLQLGDFSFGRPNRITARTRMGRGEVVDIERKVELGGPIHSKGVFILAGFLAGRYASDTPLSLEASLVFEQSYGGVEGDSASSAELYALLSAISGEPISQALAVTGSVNQHGRIQAIGGVNEKIEGFFDVCRHRGLTGDQGVLIPATNVKNLMLRQDVIDAVSQGKFHIYPVETVDQGIEILTGIPAGEPDAEGAYPPDTLNGKVQRVLQKLAKQRRAFVGAMEAGGEAE